MVALTIPYRDYLRSPEWQAVRRIAIAQAGGRCQVCNSDGPLNVHHRTYERIGQELLCDVTVLCRPCHERHHGISEPVQVDYHEQPRDGEPLPLSPDEEYGQSQMAAECFGVAIERRAA